MRIVVETQMRTLSPERNRTFGLFRSILASAPQGTNGERGGGGEGGYKRAPIFLRKIQIEIRAYARVTRKFRI